MSEKEEEQYTIWFDRKGKKVLRDEIVYVESYGRKVYFELLNEECVAYRKLDEVEQELADNNFLRIHQSYLVNMYYIDHIEDYQVYLITGQTLPIPRVRFAEVQGTYVDWKIEAFF